MKTNGEKISEIEFEKILERIREKYPNHLFSKTQELAPAILEAAGGALEKKDLIKACLEITGSANFEEIELPEEMNESLKNEDFIAKRQKIYLRRIWDEIKIFPPLQRKVLILSLKESGRVEVVTLLLKKRIATIEEIAGALEVGFQEFSDVFARLPMSSTKIADFLGIKDGEKTSKEQKIDNLRSTARQLLRRRLGIKK